jgi:hypothetical protein
MEQSGYVPRNFPFSKGIGGQNHMTLDEILEAAKSAETPDTILLVADSPLAQKLVVAWKTVDIQRTDPQLDFASLKDVWAATQFDPKQWYIHAGLSPSDNQRIGQSLIANGIVYPDGTVNELVHKFLNTQVAELVAKIKSGRTTRK